MSFNPGTSPLVKGFGRRPLAGRSCAMWGRRSKASQGGNRGQEGALFWLGAIYGDLRSAYGSGVSARWREARSVAGGGDDGERVRLQGCARLAQARRSEEGWRPCAGVASLLRRGGEGKWRCEGGSAAMVMRCRS